MQIVKIHTVGNESSSGTFARDDELSQSVSERMIDKIDRRGSLLRYKKPAREIDRSDRSSYYLNTTKQISSDELAQGEKKTSVAKLAGFKRQNNIRVIGESRSNSEESFTYLGAGTRMLIDIQSRLQQTIANETMFIE